MDHYLPEQSNGRHETLAIVGVGCELPGNISSKLELLEALRNGRDLITEVPRDRWNVDAFYDPDPIAPGKTYVRKGGFIEGIDLFDAGFFGITDAEASRMDPQQRMLLQTIWHALEDAGQSAEELMHSNTGVFLAMMNTNGYSQLKGAYEGPLGINAYDAMGDAMSIAAGRISHFLGLEGPCLTIDTACSSSLVALHLARQSILAGDCDMAIVAGVNAILHPGIHIAFSKVGLMSRAGRCAAFDASADGYIRGEGCMAVIVRRQSQAIDRGDRILATILGTAVNQDGRTPAVTAPNGRSQEKVIRSVLARSGVSPEDIGYVEAHGTGTPVGDPIEMSAIVNVFGPGRADDHPLYVGSVKSNFGHIEAGAGLLGLVKAALSLEYEEIFPSLHFNQLNPSIELHHAPVYIPTERILWPHQDKPRLAGVNSFGYSGTNAHAILQEAPSFHNSLPPQADFEYSPVRAGDILVVSAKSASSLDELVESWLDYLGQEKNIPLRDIALTAALDRTQHSHRLAVIGTEKDEIRQKLQSFQEGRSPRGLAAGIVNTRIKPKIAFMFTGQGAQYPEMGQELYKTEPHFARTIDQLAALMDEQLGVPLLELLFGENSAEYLQNTRYVQPAMFAIEYALADLLNYWGVEPDYVIGHSVGEIVAACVAGVLELEDAARFVVVRGRLMGQLPPGGKMLAIGASVNQVQKWIEGREADVSIATVNGPRAVVISGKGEAVLEIGSIAEAAGRQTKELEVSHAFHSPLMDPILEELTEAASAMRISPSRIPILSNTSGDFLSEDLPASYWSSHVRQAVLFHQGMEKIIAAGCSLLVEVGPHPSLIPAVANAFDVQSLQTIPTLKRDRQDLQNILGCLATLYVNGAAVKFDRLMWKPQYRRVLLPLYPFRREKYWLNSNGILDVAPETYKVVFQPTTQEEVAELPELPDLPNLHPLLGKVITYSTHKAVFETTLNTSSPWTDHRVLGSTIFPATAFLEMAARGFAAFTGQEWHAVMMSEVTFERPLMLQYREEKKISLKLERASNGTQYTRFAIAASSDEKTVYCRGRIAAMMDGPEKVNLENELIGREVELKAGPFYSELRNHGLEYGARFANVRELWGGKSGSGEAVGKINLSAAADLKNQDPYLNTIMLDSSLHVFGAAIGTVSSSSYQGAFVPATIQSITWWNELPSKVWSHVQLNLNEDGRAALANVRVLSEDGFLMAEFKNLELRRTIMFAHHNPSGLGNKLNNNQASDQFFTSRAQLIEQLQPMPRMERVAVLSKWLTAEIKDTMGQAAEGMNLDNLVPSRAFLEIGLDSIISN